MRLPSFIFVLTLSLGLGGRAQARLGDTLAQLTIRYGKSTNAGHGGLFFQKENWLITVWLIDGMSVEERYQKTGGPSDQDITTLLSLNAQGHTWSVKPPERTVVSLFIPRLEQVSKSWMRDDGAYAFVPGGSASYLDIASKQKLDADQAQQVAAQKAKASSLQGF